MRVLDTSSIVHAWDNYPIAQFPRMWQWIAEQIAEHKTKIPSVVVTEVGHVAPECADWVAMTGVSALPMSEDILLDALHIKNLIGIVGDKYGGGVDENDLLIIASARSISGSLISNEAVQLTLPKNMSRYKIPAVCAMDTVKVDCINFIEFMKQSKTIFG